MKITTIVTLTLLSICTSTTKAGEPEIILTPLTPTSDWAFSIEAYMIATAIEGNASIGRIQDAPVDVGFDDILKNLDMGAMAHFEAIKNNRWGIYIDYGFMDLSGGAENGFGGKVKVGVRQGVLESGILRRFSANDYTIDVFGGVRWWDNDIDIEIDSARFPRKFKASADEDWVDAIVGARLLKPINDKYTLTSHLDLGGFGLESKFTASGSLGFQYQLSESFIVDVRYKATWVDYENGSLGAPGSFGYKTITHGPLLGIIYEF